MSRSIVVLLVVVALGVVGVLALVWQGHVNMGRMGTPVVTNTGGERQPNGGSSPIRAPETSTMQTPAANAPRADNPQSGRSPSRTEAQSPTQGERGPRQQGPRMDAFRLVGLLTRIGRLEEEGKQPLTPQQAKAVLAVVNPLRKQETLAPDQARAAADKIETQLTQAQRTAIEEMRPTGGPPRGDRGSGQGPGGQAGERQGGSRPEGSWGGRGGEPGGTPPGGAPPEGDHRPAEMENFNPLNPPSDNPMASRMAERVKTAIEALERKAKK
jgi:hypothetical protein